ncbi:MAG: NTP transferase domain-containing protein [Lachnospiraceae bacterium]|nr:NTP transferase domain-containing protein [Lachnospiraceae bacterium]
MKILCIIQARMGSERLRGKVMREILGKPMITYTLDRTLKSRYIDQVVLATSDKDTETPMVEYLTDHGYNVFRGDENNVLSRYVEAEKAYDGDIIMRITGDCPLIDPVVIDEVITYFLAHNFDYVRVDVPDSFIRGFDVEIFTKSALKRVYEITGEIPGDSPYKEHVTLYMYRHPEEFCVSTFRGSELYNRNYRLCVDTTEDFQLVTRIYEHFGDRFVNGKDVIRFLDEHPEIAGINQNIEQKHV